MFAHLINILLTETGGSIWEKLDLGRWDRPRSRFSHTEALHDDCQIHLDGAQTSSWRDIMARRYVFLEGPMFDRKDTVGPAMKPRLLTSTGKTLKDRPQLRGGNRSIRGGSNGNGSM